MALNMCEMWSKGVKTAFFSKNYEKSPSGWGIRPQTVNDTFELQYTCLLNINTSPNLDIFVFQLLV